MNHNLYKLLLYFSQNKYWRLIENPNYVVSSKLGSYFNISLKDRLDDNHYDLFDEKGIQSEKIKREL